MMTLTTNTMRGASTRREFAVSPALSRSIRLEQLVLHEFVIARALPGRTPGEGLGAFVARLIFQRGLSYES